MKKVIVVNTPSGVYHIPVEVVAHRFSNFFEQDIFSEKWNIIYSNIIKEPKHAYEWMLANTRFSDWKSVSEKINSDNAVHPEGFWISMSEFLILNKE